MDKDSSRLVLVVEDDLSVRRPLIKFLEMHGFSVVTAETAEEGVDALKKQQPIAVVVDLRLRLGSGRDVVAATPPDIPVIIFSGVPSESSDLERVRPHTRLIEKNLQRAGLHNSILRFEDGQNILNFLFCRGEGPKRAADTPYLLLLDIRMPKVDGIEVLRQLKADPE